MGIRIKKVLGYGLVDVKTEEFDIVDERFNPKWTKNEWVAEPEGKTIGEYFEFSRAAAESRTHRLDLHLFKDITFREKVPELYHFLTWEPEFGLPNVLVLTPITGTDWVRNDDMIDYYEEKVRGYHGVEPHVQVLDRPLYPYESYIDKETGEYANSNVQEWIRTFHNSVVELKNPKLGKKMYGVHRNLIELALEEVGCSLHWSEKWNVKIPEQIQDFCKYVEMFRDERTIFTLVPMIYTYWS